MPLPLNLKEETDLHSEEMQDIITAVPSWLVRWGITLFFGMVVLIVALSAFIKYPDLIGASLKIDSPNSPKPIVAKIGGKLTKLLVSENSQINAGQTMAYLESTADHQKVLKLLDDLNQLQRQFLKNDHLNKGFILPGDLNDLGELQTAYQTFYQEYLAYISSIRNGLLANKISFLEKDLFDISRRSEQLVSQKKIEERDLALAEQEFTMHKKLADEKVETRAEFGQQESKYLAKRSPLIATENAIIDNENNRNEKYKEISEVNNQIAEEKQKFFQALNSLISAGQDWKSKYVLTASQSGRVSFAGIVQENQVVTPNQEIFYVLPGNQNFFGEMEISQNNMGKVKLGQKVLIKLKGYPYEEYGILNGKIDYISDIPFRDSVFMSKVSFTVSNRSDLKKPIHLKQGMLANAEIVTQNATILQRIIWSLLKMAR
jgi:multidrug efflux pump subunit AcrA (membrane-fusion protein)